jgi:hypothetical protein
MIPDYKMWRVNAKIKDWSCGGTVTNWFDLVDNEEDIKELMIKRAKEFNREGEFEILEIERIK